MLQQIIGARCVQDAAALESLVEHLVHATKVCPLGKAYVPKRPTSGSPRHEEGPTPASQPGYKGSVVALTLVHMGVGI